VRPLLVTIDGPAGAGKTTVSRRLAQLLDYRYVDTGALYRAVAWAAREAGIGPTDDAALGELCRSLQLEFHRSDSGMRLLLNRCDITDRIRTPEISMLASAVSARPAVRSCLLGLQRELGRAKCAVFEGRDMGTVVFPEADVKFYLDASPEIRALRRYRELQPNNPQQLAAVQADMRRRDESDSTRQHAPLKPAADAVVIDSTDLSIEAVVEAMQEHIRKLP